MNIYIPIWENNPHNSSNPFVSTLTDEIESKHQEIKFYYGLDMLWREECEGMNIIHIMWPNCFDEAMKNGRDLENRLKYLKNKSIKIICTCHNLTSHIQRNECSSISYSICYNNADIIIHLGSYSRSIIEDRYPQARHVVIPHHVYNKRYLKIPDKKESLRSLKLDFNKKYILCLGAFRSDKERKFIDRIGSSLKNDNIRILAPSMLIKPVGHKNPITWYKYYRDIIKYSLHGISILGKYVDDADIPYYYGASEISLIQRPDILNSGNVPLGMYMGNVVVGPDVGNVGLLLKESGNPVFDPNNYESVVRAINKGFTLSRNGKGYENHKFCLKYMSTEQIAKMHYKCYQDVV